MDQKRQPSSEPVHVRRSAETRAVRTIKTALASGLGLGLSPVAPGTLAALLGVALDLAVTLWLPSAACSPVLLLVLALVAVANQWLTPFAVRRWRHPDPREFVLDEVAGYLLVAALFREPPHLARITIGFVLVRALDAVKVPPARHVDQKLHGATGILLDDLIAALYTALVLHLGWWAWARFVAA